MRLQIWTKKLFGFIDNFIATWGYRGNFIGLNERWDLKVLHDENFFQIWYSHQRKNMVQKEKDKKIYFRLKLDPVVPQGGVVLKFWFSSKYYILLERPWVTPFLVHLVLRCFKIELKRTGASKKFAMLILKQILCHFLYYSFYS